MEEGQRLKFKRTVMKKRRVKKEQDEKSRRETEKQKRKTRITKLENLNKSKEKLDIKSISSFFQQSLFCDCSLLQERDSKVKFKTV